METQTLTPDQIKANNWYAVQKAAEYDNIDTLKYLHSITDITDGIKANNWEAVRWAVLNGNIDTLNFLMSIIIKN